MKKEYYEHYAAITDRTRLVIDKWYPMPKSDIKKDFLRWYSSSHMAVEFSHGETHFRVTFNPTWAERNRVLKEIDPERDIKKLNEITKKSKNIYKTDIKTIKKSVGDDKSFLNKIPGKCSRPDIAMAIVLKNKLSPTPRLIESLKEYENKNKPFNDEF